jgi:quinol monooxygenase YgiN
MGRGSETPMFAAMAETRARAECEERLARAAEVHASALRAQPGCRAAFVLRDPSARDFVSISVFDSAGELERAIEATRPVIARHGLPELLEGVPRFRSFEVVGEFPGPSAPRPH